MPTTLYKGYSVPTTGTEAGVWGTDINNNSFSVIDTNLGGIATITVSNVNVVLSAAQAQCAIIRVTGALTANVLVSTTTQGFMFIENLTTGAFSLSIGGTIGSTFSVSQGLVTLVIFDSTNGARPAGVEIAPGSITVFRQSAAPVGWTKLTAYNDYGLRVVSGTVGTIGASAYGAVFSSRTIAVNNLPAHSHGVSDAGHGHAENAGLGVGGYGLTSGGGYVNAVMVNGLTGLSTAVSTTGIAILNTGSGTAMDFNVLTIDVILAQKN